MDSSALSTSLFQQIYSRLLYYAIHDSLVLYPQMYNLLHRECFHVNGVSRHRVADDVVVTTNSIESLTRNELHERQS
jgi:hypothetical protein